MANGPVAAAQFLTFCCFIFQIVAIPTLKWTAGRGNFSDSYGGLFTLCTQEDGCLLYTNSVFDNVIDTSKQGNAAAWALIGVISNLVLLALGYPAMVFKGSKATVFIMVSIALSWWTFVCYLLSTTTWAAFNTVELGRYAETFEPGDTYKLSWSWRLALAANIIIGVAAILYTIGIAFGESDDDEAKEEPPKAEEVREGSKREDTEEEGDVEMAAEEEEGDVEMAAEETTATEE